MGADQDGFSSTDEGGGVTGNYFFILQRYNIAFMTKKKLGAEAVVNQRPWPTIP